MLKVYILARWSDRTSNIRRVGLPMLLEKCAQLLEEMDPRAFVEELMTLPAVSVYLVFDSRLFKCPRHIVCILDIVVPVIGTVSK